MATNDFLPFAGSVGANVVDQSTYAGLPAVASGFSSGVANSAQLNKVWRQSSIMAAVLAQLIVDNTGQNAVDDGSTTSLLGNLKTAISGRLLNVQTFTSSGTYTPTAGTKKVKVRVLGGGGPGGGATTTAAGQASTGGGGGAGGYAESVITSGFSGVAVTVGAGGLGVLGAIGSAGGTSSFGSFVSATGGSGGAIISATSSFGVNAGGTGGTSVGGNIVNCVGGSAPSVVNYGGGNSLSTNGSNSAFGMGGQGVGNASDGFPGTGYGAGGSGANNVQSQATARKGGNGAPGLVIVEEYA